jgi:hypothetical protein
MRARGIVASAIFFASAIGRSTPATDGVITVFENNPSIVKFWRSFNE